MSTSSPTLDNPFEQSVIQRLERIATALERSHNLQREDFEFRKEQLLNAHAEQQALVDRLTGTAQPQPVTGSGQRRRRGV